MDSPFPSNPLPAPRFSWLRDPAAPNRLWLSTPCVVIAWCGILLALILPPQGTGVSLCWFHYSINVPCLGCGVTRSLSCAIRGMLPESLHHHPLGIFLLLLFLVTALQSVLPSQNRTQLVRFMERHASVFNSAYLAFVGLFVLYGTSRALLQLASIVGQP